MILINIEVKNYLLNLHINIKINLLAPELFF